MGAAPISLPPDRKRRFPILQGILPFERSWLPREVVAGITLACLAIPEVMGYTRIAGMPVVTGLYTILIPTFLFAIFGSSRHLVVGADSATAAIMAAGLTGLAATASPRYVGFAGILALITAGLLIFARVARLGFIADFLSRTVLIGFLTGVGIQVAIGQIAGMLGIPGGGSGLVQKLVNDFHRLGRISWSTVVVSVAVIVVVVGARMISRKIPGALIAVVGASVVSYAANLASHGIALFGAVPRGLPMLSLPSGSAFNLGIAGHLLGVAFFMFLVILTQSAATSRAYAARHDDKFSENIDLVGLGLANLGAGFSGTFVVNGSPTKTQIVDSAGGRTQVPMLTMAAVVLIVLLFLTRPLSYMPEAVLSSVVFLIGIELVDVKGMRRILAQRPWEFAVAAVTALVVIFVGVEQGIIMAMVLSVLVHTRHGYRPKNSLVELDDKGHRRLVPLANNAEMAPGLMVYHFNHSLYYANSALFSEQVLALARSADPPLTWLCLDMSSVDDVDFTAAEALRETKRQVEGKGIELVLVEVADDVRRQLARSGLIEAFGSNRVFETLSEAETAFRAQSGTQTGVGPQGL